MKRVEDLMDTALEQAENIYSETNREGIIPNAYKGYIARFGVEVRTVGLKVTLANYLKSSNNTQQDTTLIVRAIINILRKEIYTNIQENLENTQIISSISLLQRSFSTIQIRANVLNASAALKRAMEIYKFDRS